MLDGGVKHKQIIRKRRREQIDQPVTLEVRDDIYRFFAFYRTPRNVLQR